MTLILISSVFSVVRSSSPLRRPPPRRPPSPHPDRRTFPVYSTTRSFFIALTFFSSPRSPNFHIVTNIFGRRRGGGGGGGGRFFARLHVRDSSFFFSTRCRRCRRQPTTMTSRRAKRILSEYESNRIARGSNAHCSPTPSRRRRDRKTRKNAGHANKRAAAVAAAAAAATFSLMRRVLTRRFAFLDSLVVAVVWKNWYRAALINES